MNSLLKTSLANEMNEAFVTLNFPPAKNFMISKDVIEASEVFNLIKDMPKGKNFKQLKDDGGGRYS